MNSMMYGTAGARSQLELGKKIKRTDITVNNTILQDSTSNKYIRVSLR